MSDARKLVTIEYEDNGSHYIRSVLLEGAAVLPTQADMEYYYHTLLGFQQFKVSLHIRDVPVSFSLNLIGGTVNEIPAHFPSHDIQVTTSESRNQYFRLLEHVCEMERMRAEVGFVGATNTTTHEISQGSQASQGSHRNSRYQTWVNEILSTLQSTSAFAATAPDVVPQSAIADDMTVAWILTPVLEDARDSRGNRIVTSEDVGYLWAPRLGTDLYPDIAVARRLSTVNWRVKNTRSAALARLAIEWYVECHTSSPMPSTGLSPWLLQAEEELASILSPFQNFGYQQAFQGGVGVRTGGGEGAANTPIMTLLQRMEQEYIVCGRTTTIPQTQIITPTHVQWERYLRYLLRANGITTDVIDLQWMSVLEVIRIWTQGGQAIDVMRPPPVERWVDVWSTIYWHHTSSVYTVMDTRGIKTITMSADLPTRFDMFLQTLDTHDPILGVSMTNTEKCALSEKWVKLFLEREMLHDDESRVLSTYLYDVIRKWSLQFMSLPTMDGILKPMSIGPVLTSMGYQSRKMRQGRGMYGLRYARPDKHLTEGMIAASATAFSSGTIPAPVKPVAGPSVFDILTRPDPDPVPHNNNASVTGEIHLGRF
jgi:hypothetical protein